MSEFDPDARTVSLVGRRGLGRNDSPGVTPARLGALMRARFPGYRGVPDIDPGPLERPDVMDDLPNK